MFKIIVLVTNIATKITFENNIYSHKTDHIFLKNYIHKTTIKYACILYLDKF